MTHTVTEKKNLQMGTGRPGVARESAWETTLI